MTTERPLLHNGTRNRLRHKAVDNTALCFDKPRAVNGNLEFWTAVDRRVNCPECRKLMVKSRPRPTKPA